jgi:regulator of protease activity HflC (stomatin/prohibitin superfamily)
MAWVVLTVLLGIAFFVGLVWMVVAPVGSKFAGTAITFVSLAIWGILTIALSLTTVGQREVGIQQSFSGAISDHYKTTGVQWHAPWTHIIKEDIGLLKETFVFAGGNEAVSKDQQQIDATVTLNYRVTPQDVVALYKTVGPKWRTVLLDGRIPQDFKETTALFTAPDITLRRPDLRQKTLDRLRKELCPRGDAGSSASRRRTCSSRTSPTRRSTRRRSRRRWYSSRLL